MNRKRLVFLAAVFVLLAISVSVAYAATTPPSWVSTETQNRLGSWFRKDEREAIYSLMDDLDDAGGYWSLGGNAGTTPGTHFLGTSDNQNVVFKRNGTTVGTFTTNGFDVLNNIIFENDETISNENDGELAITTPNIWIGDDHEITTGSASSGILSGDTNDLYAKWSVIAGGLSNSIQATAIADDVRYSVIAGGNDNTIATTGDMGSIVGGYSNEISGSVSYGFVGAGYNNTITSTASSGVVSGGAENTVSAAHGTIAGGYSGTVSGQYGMIPGGMNNVVTGTYSLAAGRRAIAEHNGSFVWADSTDADYTSTATDTFNVRADYVILDADVVPQAGFQIYPENATNTSARFDCSGEIDYSSEVSQTICVLPANVNIVDIEFVVTTQFNDSGTDTLNCGISPAVDPDDYVDALDVSSAGVNRMGDAGDMPYGEFGDVGASDVTVVCLYDGQNDNASAGAGTLVISYVVD
jgi:hypothetical protein